MLLLLIASTLSAQNWIKIEEVGSTDVFAITAHSGKLFAISKFNIYLSNSNGADWQQTGSSPAAESGYQSIHSHGNVLYVGTFSDGIFRSTDSGATWQNFSIGLNNSAKGIISIAGIDNFLFVGTNGSGVYRINLNGGVWESFNSGLFTFGTTSLKSIGNLLLSEIGQYCYIRYVDENSWRNVYLDGTEIQRGIYDFIKAGDYIFAGTDNGVYRGTIDADSWERKDIAAFPSRDVASFALNGSKLFAAIDFGNEHWIFESSNFGDTWDFKWHEFSWLYDMVVYDEKLWAARLDGLWFYDLSGSTDVDDPLADIPTNFMLNQNYPNPFNPSTIIKFSVPTVSPSLSADTDKTKRSIYTTLKVYDILGQEIAVLMNEEIMPGEYQVEFDGSKLSSGVYFYRIDIGSNFSSTKKMILIK